MIHFPSRFPGKQEKFQLSFIRMARTGKGLQMTLSWVPKQDGCIAPRTVEAAEGVYVCRAKHFGEVMPGKLLRGECRAQICHSGREFNKPKYEVLCESGFGNEQCFSWTSQQCGRVAPNAVVSGVAQDGQPLYIARAFINDQWVVGKLKEGEMNAQFPLNGTEIPRTQYDVLVWRKDK
ncbi:hypothetical protein CSKR_104860 [Clonorchis sinensis]|uniref:Uncharacterized protein n=2 Tax=Clonorchis sinensis TaxID=79923 RepID=A0A8T1LZG7_CLOSI|nr:hypothetical protein CSKR_104860 [Clonorchis sinensis]GAA52058.1 hypothetical protein CLF_107276 [Clonorchis sinensis]